MVGRWEWKVVRNEEPDIDRDTGICDASSCMRSLQVLDSIIFQKEILKLKQRF
jgi:hypothetical protein